MSDTPRQLTPESLAQMMWAADLPDRDVGDFSLYLSAAAAILASPERADDIEAIRRETRSTTIRATLGYLRRRRGREAAT